MARAIRSAGVGQYRSENQSWLSAKTEYRTFPNATAIDASGPTGVSAVSARANYAKTDYAAEAVLVVYAMESATAGIGSTATLQVWVSDAAAGPYFFLQTLQVTQSNQVLTITNAPPGYYKIIVTAKSADTLTIYTQFRI